ncbi:MAG: uracil-DNA glycosylase, partial [Chloroflexota bacterium]|nr:uracil-DNA glycosylase [Chloroflexota bacterium]
MTLDEIYKGVTACNKCDLYKTATRAVPGEGPENPTILFIGEAPGWHEDQQGRPFVGPAGQFLEQLLASVGLKRSQVYIANVVKHRPPGNRDPLPNEVKACRPWLDTQMELLRPKLVVTLGRHSLAAFFPRETISKARGVPREQGGVLYYPMYHPAAALHQGGLRKVIEQDMLKIPELLKRLESKS